MNWQQDLITMYRLFIMKFIKRICIKWIIFALTISINKPIQQIQRIQWIHGIMVLNMLQKSRCVFNEFSFYNDHPYNMASFKRTQILLFKSKILVVRKLNPDWIYTYNYFSFINCCKLFPSLQKKHKINTWKYLWEFCILFKLCLKIRWHRRDTTISVLF